MVRSGRILGGERLGSVAPDVCTRQTCFTKRCNLAPCHTLRDGGDRVRTHRTARDWLSKSNRQGTFSDQIRLQMHEDLHNETATTAYTSAKFENKLFQLQISHMRSSHTREEPRVRDAQMHRIETVAWGGAGREFSARSLPDPGLDSVNIHVPWRSGRGR